MDPGVAFTAKLRRITSKRPPEAAAVSGDASARVPAVEHTRELYRVPRIREGRRPLSWAKEVDTWPRYEGGVYRLGGQGESLLELSKDEADALSSIIVNTSVKQEKYGAAHQVNWKKVGLSRAYYQKERVCEASMPTDRSRAALRFLLANAAFHRVFHREQQRRLGTKSSLNISSYDFFIVQSGIECAMYPHLYPTTDFTDTGIQEQY